MLLHYSLSNMYQYIIGEQAPNFDCIETLTIQNRKYSLVDKKVLVQQPRWFESAEIGYSIGAFLGVGGVLSFVASVLSLSSSDEKGRLLVSAVQLIASKVFFSKTYNEDPIQIQFLRNKFLRMPFYDALKTSQLPPQLFLTPQEIRMGFLEDVVAKQELEKFDHLLTYYKATLIPAFTKEELAMLDDFIQQYKAVEQEFQKQEAELYQELSQHMKELEKRKKQALKEEELNYEADSAVRREKMSIQNYEEAIRRAQQLQDSSERHRAKALAQAKRDKELQNNQPYLLVATKAYEERKELVIFSYTQDKIRLKEEIHFYERHELNIKKRALAHLPLKLHSQEMGKSLRMNQPVDDHLIHMSVKEDHLFLEKEWFKNSSHISV